MKLEPAQQASLFCSWVIKPSLPTFHIDWEYLSDLA